MMWRNTWKKNSQPLQYIPQDTSNTDNAFKTESEWKLRGIL